MATVQAANNEGCHKHLDSPELYIDQMSYGFDCWFDADEGFEEREWAASRQLEDRVRDWCLWFAQNHPPEADLRELAQKAYWETDFRIFFLAYPVAGAAILRLVDAYYKVDKAICGTSQAALNVVEKWRAMDPFKYLLSEDLMSWWETDLCQLHDGVEQDKSSRLANLIRVQKIEAAASLASRFLQTDDFDAFFYQRMLDEGWPDPFKLDRRIAGHENLLSTSPKGLKIAVKQQEDRLQQKAALAWNSNNLEGVSTSYQDQERIYKGIRRRMPNVMTTDGDSAMKDSVENDAPVSNLITSTPLDVTPSVGSEIINSTTHLMITNRINALGQNLFRFLLPATRRRTSNKLLDFITHKSTVLCLTLCLAGISVALIAVSAIHAQTELSQDKPTLDGSFYSTFSQATLSLLTIYLAILAPLRNRSLNLRYGSWFWLCLILVQSPAWSHLPCIPRNQLHH